MSTAYPPRFIKYVFTSKKERNAARTAPMAPDSYGHFPSTFGLFYYGPGADFLSERFHISTTHPDDSNREGERLYAVTFHKGPGVQQMTLYSTPQHGGTPMAISTNEKRFSSSGRIRIGENCENLHYTGFGSNKHQFTFQGEKFELREDRSVRPIKRRLYAIESDRLLATWREGSAPTKDRRLAIFQFEGDAAQTRGDYWSLMAVCTVLTVVQQGPAIDGTLSWHQEKMLEKGDKWHLEP